MTIRVTGARELRASLKRAGLEVTQLKDVNLKVANLVTAAAIATSPYGPPSVHVKDSIRAGATQRAAIVRAGKKSIPYAKALHGGWYKPGVGKRGTANPWIATAAKDLEPAWVALYEKEIDAILNRIKGA